MPGRTKKATIVTFVTGLALLAPLHSGCDETLQTNIENSLIDTATGAFGSLLTAIVEIATEQLAADLNNNTNGS